MKRFIIMAVSVIISNVLFISASLADNTVSSTVTGTTTVDKTPPTASAPNIIINNSDICRTGISTGLQTDLFGIANGLTIEDKNSERLKLARSLFGMGMKVAAVSALCQDERVFDAMMMAGTPCPYEGKIGDDALELWVTNLDNVPEGSQFKERTEKKQAKKLAEVKAEEDAKNESVKYEDVAESYDRNTWKRRPF